MQAGGGVTSQSFPTLEWWHLLCTTTTPPPPSWFSCTYIRMWRDSSRTGTCNNVDHMTLSGRAIFSVIFLIQGFFINWRKPVSNLHCLWLAVSFGREWEPVTKPLWVYVFSPESPRILVGYVTVEPTSLENLISRSQVLKFKLLWSWWHLQ